MIMDSLLSGGGLEILFFIGATLAISFFIIALARNMGERGRNRRAPLWDVDAEVVAKRTQVSHHIRMHLPLSHHVAAYYATFRTEGGDRMELRLSGDAYKTLRQGDRGRLCFQGTRYIAFVC